MKRGGQKSSERRCVLALGLGISLLGLGCETAQRGGMGARAAEVGGPPTREDDTASAVDPGASRASAGAVSVRRGLRETILAQLGTLENSVEHFPSTRVKSRDGVEVYSQSISVKGVGREALVGFLGGVSRALTNGHCVSVQIHRARQRQAGFFDATSVLWNAKFDFVNYGTPDGLPPVLRPIDAVSALGEILEVLAGASSSDQNFQLESIDLRLATRNHPTNNSPSAESNSRLILTSDSLASGDRLSRLLDATKVWHASPAVVARGAKMQVTMTLQPKKSYLRSLAISPKR